MPAGAGGSFAASAPRRFALTPEEARCGAKFSPRRMADFVLGRYCAVQALRGIGVGRHTIPPGEGRAPEWPPSIVGAISHTDGVAGALVAHRDAYLGIGLDLERLQPIGHLAEQICTAQEHAAATAADVPAEHLNVLFGAKEALYKCIWPLVRRFVAFDEVGLTLDFASRTFAVAANRTGDPRVGQVRGRWRIGFGIVAVSAILPAEAVGRGRPV